MKKFNKKEYNAKYWLENKEKLKEWFKNYRQENKEKIKVRMQRYYQENKERINEQSRRYHQENKEKIKLMMSEYYKKNREIIIEKTTRYRQENKERVNKRNTKRIMKLYHSDVEFKLSVSLRNYFRNKLKAHLANKNSSALSLAGCTIEELKAHIESKFEEGMSWENWALDGWHLDHIIPCSSFDLTIEEEQKKCFHYTNLQPLWAKDNLSKHNKLNWSKEDMKEERYTA